MSTADAKSHVTVTSGNGGHFVVFMQWDEFAGYFYPWQHGAGALPTHDAAAKVAAEWSEADRLRLAL